MSFPQPIFSPQKDIKHNTCMSKIKTKRIGHKMLVMFIVNVMM